MVDLLLKLWKTVAGRTKCTRYHLPSSLGKKKIVFSLEFFLAQSKTKVWQVCVLFCFCKSELNVILHFVLLSVKNSSNTVKYKIKFLNVELLLK